MSLVSTLCPNTCQPCIKAIHKDGEEKGHQTLLSVPKARGGGREADGGVSLLKLS